MLLIKRSTEVLNPAQTPVMTCNQPINAIAKQLQWNGLDPAISEGQFFLMLGSLHLEKASLKLIGDILKTLSGPDCLPMLDFLPLESPINLSLHLTLSRLADHTNSLLLYYIF